MFGSLPGPSLAEIGPELAELGQHSSKLVEGGPVWPTSTIFGAHRPTLVDIDRTNVLVESGPKLAEVRLDLAEIAPTVSSVRQVRFWPRSSPQWPIRVEPDPLLARFGPTRLCPGTCVPMISGGITAQHGVHLVRRHGFPPDSCRALAVRVAA